MSSNSSGKKLEGFFTGKGFYIVLFLCAAVIGVSAWMMAAGNETMAENVSNVNTANLDNQRVETVVIPSQKETERVPNKSANADAPQINDEGIADTTEKAGDVTEEVWRQGDTVEVAGDLYAWPVSGELERSHSLEALKYDVTMRDWRTHNGIDISAELGTTITAAHAGFVESIIEDDLYGTVLTVDHGDGSKTVYANLAATPAANVGDWVEPGSVIGSVGTTAICEIGQGTHLHFSITVDGVGVDPLQYLPA